MAAVKVHYGGAVAQPTASPSTPPRTAPHPTDGGIQSAGSWSDFYRLKRGVTATKQVAVLPSSRVRVKLDGIPSLFRMTVQA